VPESLKENVLFKILGLNVTAEVITMWVIIAVVTLISAIGTRRLKDRPGRLQNALELAVEKLTGFFSGILGKDRARRFLPLFGTLFIFIIVSNYSGLLPGAGAVRGFGAPTSSLSVTAGLAIVVFVSTHFLGVKCRGLKGYLCHYIKPVFFMLPFLLIEEIVRPLSLSLRLYGNIYGEESVTHQLYELIPIGVPLIMMVLSLLFCTIQAVVFTMLSAIYIDEATGIEE
jgi:F-type H+-transporting ATPase subunit a